MTEPANPQRPAVTPDGSPEPDTVHSWRSYWPWLTLAFLGAATVLQLRLQGRLWWCACSQPHPWSGDIWSRHNSQHLFDPYSLTHVLHGVVLYWLLAWTCPRLPLVWRLCLAVGIEALFEGIENTAFVIQRYRETAALEYEGDTVANSLMDIVCYAAGFALARRLGPWGSLALFVVTEVVLVFWIKDSLLLNVLMLVYPLEAVKEWQLRR